MDQHQEAHRQALEAQERANREQQSRLQSLDREWDSHTRAADQAGGSRGWAEASVGDKVGLAVGTVVLVLLLIGAVLAWSRLGGEEGHQAVSAPRSGTDGERSAGGRDQGAATPPARGEVTTVSPIDTGGDAPSGPAAPDYVGKLRGDVAAELEGGGHPVTVVYRDGAPGCTDPEAVDEVVFSQAPAPGELLAPGVPVTLTVQRFSGDKVAVPDLVGLAVDDARSVTTNLELTLAFETAAETGSVEWQSKPPCTRLFRGADVLVVRAG